jgi:hypothetical protein
MWVSHSEGQPENSAFVTDLEVQWPLSLSQEPVEAPRTHRSGLLHLPEAEDGLSSDPRAKAGARWS